MARWFSLFGILETLAAKVNDNYIYLKRNSGYVSVVKVLT